MATDYSEILTQCKGKLFFYSPYRFIRGQDQDTIFTPSVLTPWLDKISRGLVTVKSIIVDHKPHFVLIEPLPWDTEYFGFPVYKILTVLYTHGNYSLLKKALLQLTSEISNQINSFYFLDIPSEDTYLIQAVCECGFRLTETRLHYAFSITDSYCHERYQVRKATEHDVDNLRKVAIQMRNPYDRLHADIAFKQDTADVYAATYVENSIRGFADLVLVPAEGNGPPDAFITCSLTPGNICNKKFAKIGMVAVFNKTRKGWMMKLISELIYLIKDKGYDYILVDTQSPNMPANKVFASRGFKFVFATHVFVKRIVTHSCQM
jgi:dTDP-4-amino-4,6-dideoxy-D-galactose acyltransferase